MNRMITGVAVFAVGAACAAAFSFSSLDPSFGGFVLALVALGLLTSLIFGRWRGMIAGAGVAAAFMTVGIVNGLDRGASFDVFLTLPLVLAAVFMIVAIGSAIGEFLRVVAIGVLDMFN